MKKRIVSLLLTVLLVVTGTAVTVSAQEVDPNELISPHYEMVCPNSSNGGKHDMVANGAASVYTGTYDNPVSLVFKGFAWRCSACGEMVGTEGSPLRSGTIGRYSLGYVVYTNTAAHFYGGVTGTCYGNYKDHSYFKYCLFRYA